jgi:(E)-4-hydroxy-3-methylbut-2-enyl-diphosphate synthase
MLQRYCVSLTEYKRLPTAEVAIGNLKLGNGHPIRIQTMTTTNTLDTAATVAQTIRCIDAGAELVRITAPSKKEAENLANIKKELLARGYNTPLIADIHYTPNAAEVAARIVEKVRINPGNYIDKKKFDIQEYSDSEYAQEIDRIRERFTPLVKICREYGTAMRIGTNHGSLSDRIMSRFGDTPMGMVESAMEFLRIARDEHYHQIILSMKSSNPLVMVQAYRLLVHKMEEEFGMFYPLHLGVTEAGDGEDGRIKSAIGICSLLDDGIGDTIRVSLTEDPEFEIPVCKDIVKRYAHRPQNSGIIPIPVNSSENKIHLPYNPFEYKRRATLQMGNNSENIPPIVVADYSTEGIVSRAQLAGIGYVYAPDSDKWNIADGAADYIYTGNTLLDFDLPGTLLAICNYDIWSSLSEKHGYLPLLSKEQYLNLNTELECQYFVSASVSAVDADLLIKLANSENGFLVIHTDNVLAVQLFRRLMVQIDNAGNRCRVVFKIISTLPTVDEQLINFAAEAGGLMLDGFGDGLWLSNDGSQLSNSRMSGRTYMEVNDNFQFLNNTAFSILQATRTRISKTEYISCPSCGRTLFDLQETTGKIRNATQHLKGVKIAIMGCIVNGPGEMADADFGYVGSGPGKITLYKGKEVVKKNIPSETAVGALIELLQDSGVWVER